jgi:hypothetical protein
MRGLPVAVSIELIGPSIGLDRRLLSRLIRLRDELDRVGASFRKAGATDYLTISEDEDFVQLAHRSTARCLAGRTGEQQGHEAISEANTKANTRRTFARTPSRTPAWDQGPRQPRDRVAASALAWTRAPPCRFFRTLRQVDPARSVGSGLPAGQVRGVHAHCKRPLAQTLITDSRGADAHPQERRPPEAQAWQHGALPHHGRIRGWLTHDRRCQVEPARSPSIRTARMTEDWLEQRACA